MTTTFADLTKERQLTLICSRGTLNSTHEEQVREILSGPVDWKDILYQGITHRTLNIMYYHLKNLGLLGKVENEVLKAMKTQSTVYGLRNRSYFAEIKKIFDRFKEAGIRAAILKGNFLAANVYPSVETRTFNDLDFLINMEDGDKILEILTDMGYIQGQYDDAKADIIPATRKQKIMHQLGNGELHECLKMNDEPFTPLFNVDLNYTVLWKGNCPYEIDTAELLDRAIDVDVAGADTLILDYEDFLIQLACHLFKEATIISWIHDLRDLKIYKFADIQLFVEKFSDQIDWKKLVDFCKKVEVEKVVFYAFHFVNMMYGDVIPADVMFELEPEDKEYLDEYGIDGKGTAKWDFDFFTRLFETSRVLEVSEDMLSVVQNYWDNRDKMNK